MKLELSLGGDTAKRTAVVPVLKAALLGALVLVVVNRADIRRYLRLRRM